MERSPDVPVWADQKENVPSGDPSPLGKRPTDALNFPELTASRFGISVQSFAPSAAPKDKSIVAQLKARRKSSIGARGSPETNSLIRFMAQQKIKSASPSQSPELRVASTLKQKMASFQNLMDVEESQVYDLLPRPDSSTGGCIRTEDDLSDRDGHNLEREKENYPSRVTPKSGKRKWLNSSESCRFEMTDTKVPIFSWSQEDQEEMEKGATQGVTQAAAAPSCDFAAMVQTDLVSSSLPVLFDLWPSHPPESQQGCGFEHSVQLSPGASAAPLPYQPTSSISAPPLSAELDLKPPAVKKKKSVHFGNPLSPEVFDKTMPPSTPLRKGGTPARTPTPGRGLRLRSALKTPQASDSDWAGPDPGNPFVFGASPTPVTPVTRRTLAAADSEEEGKIVFPSTEEFDSELPDAEYVPDVQPLNLNTAFYEESISQTQAEFENYSSKICPTDELQPEPETQPGATVGAPPRHRTKRKKQPAPNCDHASDTSSESSSGKREQSGEVEPVKRSSRSAAKLACGKMKASAAPRKWNKEVDRSLYSSRAYASKNPTLSPIKERRSFILQPPVAENDDANLNLKTEPAVLEKQPEDSLGYRCAPEIAMGTDKKQPGLDKEKSSVGVQLNVVTAGETVDEEGGEHTAAHPEASWELPLTHTVPEPRLFDPTVDQTSAGTCSSVSDTPFDGTVALRAASSPRPPSAESPDNERQRKVKRGRRSSAIALQPHAGCKAAEGDQKEEQHTVPPSSERPDNGRAASVELAPWQSDFDLEDVFRPVATRGQRSVRRSLRNQSVRDQSCAGLAWLPRTSPDSIREVRRRTRGRRLSAVSLSEET